MRATIVVAMLIVAVGDLFVGGYLAVILVFSFVVPSTGRIVAASALVLATVFAITRAGTEGTDCDAAPTTDGIYVPLFTDMVHATA